MELITSFIFNAIITAVAYLIVPVIFCVIGLETKRKYSLSTIRKIVIVNGACVWLLFRIILISTGETGSGAAVFLWSGVAYWMMKKFCLEKEIKNEEPVKPKEDNYNKEPVNPFLNIDKKEKRYKIAIVVVSLLLALSCGLNIYQSGINSDLEYKLEQSPAKLDFFDEHIVFVEDDDTNLYHKYDCYRFTGDYFWAYNTELAISIGYQPCSICCRE